MRTQHFQKLVLIICLFFSFPIMCNDIFFEFAQALEIAGEPLSRISIVLSPKETAPLLDSLTKTNLKTTGDLKTKVSDIDFKKLINKWLTEGKTTKNQSKLETEWNNKRQQQKPKKKLEKTEIKATLEATLQKIRNVVEENAFKDVKPPTKEAGLKRKLAENALALTKAYKEFDKATDDDLRKIDYFIGETNSVINQTAKSTYYDELKNKLEKKEKPVEKIELGPQNPIIIEEYAQLKKDLFNSKKPDQEKLDIITKDLVSIQEKLRYESGIPYMLQPTTASPTALANSWLDLTNKKFKAWQTEKPAGSDIWILWLTGILTNMQAIDLIIKNAILLETEILHTLSENIPTEEKELKKAALKGKDLIPLLHGLGIPRLGQILSARAQVKNLAEFQKTFQNHQESTKKNLLLLLKEISARYNKKRLYALLVYAFLDKDGRGSKELIPEPNLETEIKRFTTVGPAFIKELKDTQRILFEAKKAEDKWIEDGSKEDEQPIHVSKKREDIEEKYDANWFKAFEFLKAQEKSLFENYYLDFYTADNQTKKTLNTLKNIQNTENALWNIDQNQREILVKMLQSPKPLGNNDIKEDWENELKFFPFIFIAACLDPSLIDTEIAAFLDRLFALKENDSIDYSTKRLRYLLAVNEPKSKTKKTYSLEPELDYFFELMGKKGKSKIDIKKLLTD